MLPRISSNASRKIVGLFMATATGVTGFFVYQRVVLGNPMRLGFDDEGVWGMISKYASADGMSFPTPHPSPPPPHAYAACSFVPV